MDFVTDMIERKNKISEIKASRFSEGNSCRVDSNFIKKYVVDNSSEKVMKAVINSGLEKYFIEKIV